MYLLYIDESGPSNSDYFVVGGLLIHEQEVRPLANAVGGIADQLPEGRRQLEFHAHHMRSGSGAWRRVPAPLRRRLTDELAETVIAQSVKHNRPIRLLSVALHRPSNRHHDVIERAYEEFFARANGFLGRLANAGDLHRCIAISDETREKVYLQPLMRNWQAGGGTTGANIRPLTSYVEVPLFLDSEQSRLVQLADFVAHWVYRAYEHGDTSMLDRLLPAFDSDDQVIHGLVHLVRDYRTCDCAACGSRRR